MEWSLKIYQGNKAQYVLTKNLIVKTVRSGLGESYMDTHCMLVKALVWFWIIDETLVLTSILSMCRFNEVGTCQVMEQVMIMVIMVMTTR